MGPVQPFWLLAILLRICFASSTNSARFDAARASETSATSTYFSSKIARNAFTSSAFLRFAVARCVRIAKINGPSAVVPRQIHLNGPSHDGPDDIVFEYTRSPHRFGYPRIKSRGPERRSSSPRRRRRSKRQRWRSSGAGLAASKEEERVGGGALRQTQCAKPTRSTSRPTSLDGYSCKRVSLTSSLAASPTKPRRSRSVPGSIPTPRWVRYQPSEIRAAFESRSVIRTSVDLPALVGRSSVARHPLLQQREIWRAFCFWFHAGIFFSATWGEIEKSRCRTEGRARKTSGN